MSQRMASLEMPTLGYARSAAPTLKVVDTHKDDESINTVRLADNAKETVHGFTLHETRHSTESRLLDAIVL